MPRIPLPVVAAAVLVAGASLAGCDHRAAVAQYNPTYDGLLPTYVNAAPDASILEDQRTLYNRMRDANAAAHPAAPAAAPASAPAATPGTPPPPPPA